MTHILKLYFLEEKDAKYAENTDQINRGEIYFYHFWAISPDVMQVLKNYLPWQDRVSKIGNYVAYDTFR